MHLLLVYKTGKISIFVIYFNKVIRLYLTFPQIKVRETDDLRGNSQVNSDLQTLISVLESPVFQSILSIQDSLKELKKQVCEKITASYLSTLI